MRSKLSITLAVSAGLLGATTVSTLGAQQTPAARQLVMSASNVTAKAEAEASKRAADSVRAMLPGDVMEYRMVFTNTTSGEVRNVTFDNPLPAGLTYAEGTASADRADTQVEYSIDGGTSWSAKPEIEVMEEGRKVRRAAPPELYTHVRWRITGGVAPGAKVVARYRARVKGPAGTAPSR